VDNKPRANDEKVLDEVLFIGETEAARERNRKMLLDYDYDKYCSALTGFAGQDLQRIAILKWKEAIRVRIGSRGNYKAGMTRMDNGRLVLAACRNNNSQDPVLKAFNIFVYQSEDEGISWVETGKTVLYGKEPSLTALPDGSLFMTSQPAYSMGPGIFQEDMNVYRSLDGGHTWDGAVLKGNRDYPRNLIIEPDGSLLMIRSMKCTYWYQEGERNPNLQIARSYDGGYTWNFTEAIVDWDYCGFMEISAVRLKDGRLLAALRQQTPWTRGESFGRTVLTESSDDGISWTKPRAVGNMGEVHAYLTELNDGRIVLTYSNYHLPFGVCAIVSYDYGKTWDTENPVQLALSADFYAGWPVTCQLPDGSLITSYATTAYYKQPPDITTCEVVKWKL